MAWASGLDDILYQVYIGTRPPRLESSTLKIAVHINFFKEKTTTAAGVVSGTRYQAPTRPKFNNEKNYFFYYYSLILLFFFYNFLAFFFILSKIILLKPSPLPSPNNIGGGIRVHTYNFRSLVRGVWVMEDTDPLRV